MPKTPDVAASEPARVAIPRLVELHGDRIYRMGLHLCATPQDAEDMVQETFLRAYRAWDRFEGRSSPSTWLYTIASRVAKRQYRRRAGEPQKVRSLFLQLPSGEEGVVDIASPDGTPLDRIERAEAAARLEGLVGELPLKFQLPLVLKDVADFSIAEIADILGLKRNTVKTRIYRARMALRRALVEGLPRRADLPMDRSRRVCLDLLYAKQEALDRGVPFPLPHDWLCARCHAVFATLDLTQEVFRQLHAGELPPSVRAALQVALESGEAGIEV